MDKEFDEESEGWVEFLEKVCKDVGIKARKEAFDLGLSVIVVKDGDNGYGLYYDNPDGTSTFHKSLPPKTKIKNDFFEGPTKW